MRLACLFSVFQYPQQLARLIQRLNHPDMDLFIHINKQVDRKLFVEAVNKSKTKNVSFIENRTRVYWGGWSHTLAILQSMREILKKKISFDYLLLLSGQDYPLVDNQKILGHFEKNQGKEFINCFPLPSTIWKNQNDGLDRIEKYYLLDLYGWLQENIGLGLLPDPIDKTATLAKKIFSLLPKRKFPASYRPWGGRPWWKLSQECVKYVLDFADQHPEFLRFFRYVFAPEETFFPTVIMNSPFADQVAYDNLLCEDWLPSGRTVTWVSHDFNHLANSGKLLGRKFNMTVDSKILDLIDNKLLNVKR